MSTRADACSRIVEMHSAEMVEGYLMDVMTAEVLLRVYEALGPEARDKFDSVPLPRLVDFSWKQVVERRAS
jgi:hypothetical protein